MSSLYPVFLKLDGKAVLVVGGGPVALRRTRRLLEAGARVTIVSPALCPDLSTLAERGAVVWTSRKVAEEDLDGASLVLVAAGDPALTAWLPGAARRRGLWIGWADAEELSDLHVPAAAASGRVQVAVSTAGASPAGAARLASEIGEWLQERALLVESLLALGRGPSRGEPAPGDAGSREATKPARAEETAEVARKGTVYLVGAGPGAGDLLTLRADRLLRTADMIFHDRLVGAAVLDRVGQRAQVACVGKVVGCPAQGDVAERLIQSAREGKAVVRLKGGDPLIFGRGGEEMEALRAAGVPFMVVPGVSALSAAPASTGFPLTRRGVADEVVVRTGHHGAEGEPEDQGWPGVSGSAPAGRAPGRAATHVYFMAARRLPAVVEELRREGVDPGTPAAIIEKATLPGERVVVSTLESIAHEASLAKIEPPALLVVGAVVRQWRGDPILIS